MSTHGMVAAQMACCTGCQGSLATHLGITWQCLSAQVAHKHGKNQAQHVELFSAIKELDLVVLMDVTGSMGRHIAAVRQSIEDVLREISTRWAKRARRRLGC